MKPTAKRRRSRRLWLRSRPDGRGDPLLDGSCTPVRSSRRALIRMLICSRNTAAWSEARSAEHKERTQVARPLDAPLSKSASPEKVAPRKSASPEKIVPLKSASPEKVARGSRRRPRRSPRRSGGPRRSSRRSRRRPRRSPRRSRRSFRSPGGSRRRPRRSSR